MGNQNMPSNDRKNILLIGNELLEERGLLKSFFNHDRIETIGNIDSIKITSIQRKNENECAIWLLKYKDLNFENIINALIKTVKITSLVVCLYEQDDNMIKEMSIFLKQYTCEEYLRGISLGIIALDQEDPYKKNSVKQDLGNIEGIKNDEQEKAISLYMRQLKLEKDLCLRDLDPRIIKQIQIINIIQASKIAETVTTFIERLLEAKSI